MTSHPGSLTLPPAPFDRSDRRPCPCRRRPLAGVISLVAAGAFGIASSGGQTPPLPSPSASVSGSPAPRRLALPAGAPSAARIASPVSPSPSAAPSLTPLPSLAPVAAATPSPAPVQSATPGPLRAGSPPPSLAGTPAAEATPPPDDAVATFLPPVAAAPDADGARLSRVRRVELRADVPAPIPVALNSEEGEGTLVSFPAPIRHLDGFGVVYQAPTPATRADFYILWPGAGGNAAASAGEDNDDDSTLSHFVVTGLRKNARKVLSVVLQGYPRPFTIVLIQTDDDNAALSVQFDPPGAKDGSAGNGNAAAPGAAAASYSAADPVAAGSAPGTLFPAGWDGTRVPISAARLNGFLTKVKGYPTLSKLKPEIYQGIEAVQPPVNLDPDQWPGGLQARIVRVLRDHRLDSMGFEVRLDNPGPTDFVYDPNALGVRVQASTFDANGAVATGHPSDELYRARLAEASGRVVAGSSATAFFVVAAGEEGGTNDLSPRNRFRVVLEPPQPLAVRRAVAGTAPAPARRLVSDRTKD